MVAAVLVAAAMSFNAVADKGKKAAPASINVDTQKSTLGWYGKKFTGDHNGTINITKGSLQVDKTKLVGGSFDIDMNSIVCKDVTDANYNAKLVNHLKSDDFFNAAQFPVSNFKITKVAPIAQTGDMHLASMEFETMTFYVANASPYINGSCIPAYQRPPVALSMNPLFNMSF